MLPAIYFVFSRAGCDASVRYLMEAGLTLTTHQEALRIREIADTIESPTYDIRNGTRLELVLIGMCLQAHDPIAEEFFQFAKHAGLEAANFRAGGLRHALRR